MAYKIKHTKTAIKSGALVGRIGHHLVYRYKGKYYYLTRHKIVPAHRSQVKFF